MQIPARVAGILYFTGVSKPKAPFFPGIHIIPSFTPNTPVIILKLTKNIPIMIVKKAFLKTITIPLQ